MQAQPHTFMPFTGPRTRPWAPLAMASLYLLLHVAGLVVFAGHAKLISYGFLIGAPVLASAACLACARSSGVALNWYAQSLGLFLWAGGMAATMYIEIFTQEGGIVSGLATLLFVLYGVPLTFIAASPAEAIWPARLTDAALALALGGLFFGCTFTFATVTNANDDAVVNIRLMYDIQNALVVGFSYVRYKASDNRSQRDVFRVMALFAAIYMIAAAFINHLETNTDFGGPTDLAIDIPFLVMFAMAARRVAGACEAPPSPASPQFSLLVRTISPIMLPLTLFAVSCFLIFRNPWLAVAGFMAALVGHGVRGILVELRSQADNGRLEQLSRVDPLTQLFNRRTFDETLAREFARASRSSQGLSLLMIDIDHFKMLNDTYGHPEGDRYLREVSRTLGSLSSRAGDLVARYGGEEFSIILPDTSEDAAMGVAEKILGAVVGLALPSPASRGVVTVSIGVASTGNTQAGDAAQLLAAADAALYRAKQSGRNRAVRSEPERQAAATA